MPVCASHVPHRRDELSVLAYTATAEAIVNHQYSTATTIRAIGASRGGEVAVSEHHWFASVQLDPY